MKNSVYLPNNNYIFNTNNQNVYYKVYTFGKYDGDQYRTSNYDEY